MPTRFPGDQEAVSESGSKTDLTFELTDGQWEIIEQVYRRWLMLDKQGKIDGSGTLVTGCFR